LIISDKADKHESDKDEKGSDEGSNEGASDIDDLLDNLDNDEEMEANEAEIPIEQPEDENRFDEILHPGGSTEPEEDSPIEEEEERKRDDVGDIEASAEKDVSFKRAENDNDSPDEGTFFFIALQHKCLTTNLNYRLSNYTLLQKYALFIL
jgi:hypothetical protein